MHLLKTYTCKLSPAFKYLQADLYTGRSLPCQSVELASCLMLEPPISWAICLVNWGRIWDSQAHDWKVRPSLFPRRKSRKSQEGYDAAINSSGTKSMRKNMLGAFICHCWPSDTSNMWCAWILAVERVRPRSHHRGYRRGLFAIQGFRWLNQGWRLTWSHPKN